ncbi:undecaprenyldiphospho-muramoylpentapeptide beta-N-acetylglucosaminyltransferase [Massiliimalia massiliensis]|uniref:undecaprenyldiphospho-muramoylpentapeptide beta-N-acetylglucosaminyltransferase n=1 Tax=Massiliimalia massiliensis TaxID=1852384 RepID=UPI000985EAA0|nr:undecaprenyldiphospho-muramoylpentapeptide beta-N-acetylglucosaminyltransferase [Massiliimalia massiliensis]MBS1473942.1 undecaprenyldiphospho-muramoylpentapeptide beta-N-acetylglucosaminyltransferase [Massiliimalia sp.]
MRVLLAGGGTAGHINPAIAIAQYIRSKDERAEILFAGTPQGMEAQLVAKAGFDFTPVQVSGFRRKLSVQNIVHNIKTVCHVVTADFVSKRIIRDFQPDVVIGTGGYVSGPVVLAAAKLGIKTMIHEQNAFPGVTNKLLAKKVDTVMLAVAEAKEHFDPEAHCEVVGNPVRQSVIFKTKEEARKSLGLDKKVCILSFGGSLGAKVINHAAADLIEWNYQQDKINHIHGYGRLGKEHFPQMVEERGIPFGKLLGKKADPNIDVREYIDNMDTCLAAADLVICRSGAITLSELQATGKASILVPSPYVAENHQFHNAMVLVNHGAAMLIEEKDYDKDSFLRMIESVYQDREKLNQLGKNASKLAILDSTERIYRLICGLI